MTKEDIARWLEEMHDYARPEDQPYLLAGAEFLRGSAEPPVTHAHGGETDHCLQCEIDAVNRSG